MNSFPSRDLVRLRLAVLLAAFFGTAAWAEELAPIQFLAEWGSKGAGPGQFHFPIGIAINASDEVLVSDFYNDRVQKFSVEGKLLGVMSVLPNPGGIAISRSGEIYLSHFAEKKRAERTTDRISVYEPSGKLLRQWGRTGSGDGEFDCPGGIALGKDGRVYVADQTNRRVQVFDPGGKALSKWGEYGSKPGQFGGKVSRLSRVGGPQFVAIDAEGHVFTTEGSECRVQQFTPEGKLLGVWGEDSDKPGGFAGGWLGGKLKGPVGLCVDGETLWVTSVNGRVQQFTLGGKYLRGLTEEPGSEPGQFMAPHGVALDREGNLYVVDAFNHRVQKFATR
ncbi:NHL repeat-containing protein [Singulisphaera rosea]